MKKATREESRAAALAVVEASLGEEGYRMQPWQVLGPFELQAPNWHQIAFPADGATNFVDTDFAGAGGQRIRWRPWPIQPDGQGLDLSALGRGVVGYAARRIVADREMNATFFSDAPGMIMWLNGERIVFDPGPHSMTPDSQETPVQLRKGINYVLIKTGNVGWGFGFQFRVTGRSREERARKQRLLDDIENHLQLDFPAGEEAYYSVESVPIPLQIVLEASALGSRSDGSIFVATRRGEIWTADLAKQDWRLFATGLHEPLGILIENDHQIVVAQRPELTRIKDTNLDGAADTYETVADQFGLSGNFHEFHYGPVRDAAGNLYGTLNLAFVNQVMRSSTYLRGWAYKLTPSGQFTPYALGFRSPVGIGVSPDGDIFVVDSQGEWFGASPLIHLQPGKFYGNPASFAWAEGFQSLADPNVRPADLERYRTPPAAWFVHESLGRAPGEPIWDTTGGKFGPFSGQMFVGDQSKSTLLRVALEKVGGEWQGAIFPFRKGFSSGLVRATWLQDGALLVGMTGRGWPAAGGRAFGLQKVSWTGALPMEIQSLKVTKTGFDLTFTKPLDPAVAGSTKAYSLKYFHYLYHSTYGSPQQGETPVPVTAAKLSADRKTVSLVLPSLVAGKIYELHLSGMKAADGSEVVHPEAYYTLNKLAP